MLRLRQRRRARRWALRAELRDGSSRAPARFAPPPEHVLPRPSTAPILHLCDAAQTEREWLRIAARASELGGYEVEVYLERMRGDARALAADARAADPARCEALVAIFERSAR